MSKELRKAGLKVTLPRVKIMEVLDSSDKRHLSAEEIYRLLVEQGEDFGLATVYRVLTQFESVGIVQRHNFDGSHAVFEMDRGEHHDHMVCVESSEVFEFRSDEIEVIQRRIAAQRGFEIIGHSLVLYVKPKKQEK